MNNNKLVEKTITEMEAAKRARRKLDAEGVSRKGKDVAHVKALSKGGSNKDGIRLEAPSKNRSFARKSSGAMK